MLTKLKIIADIYHCYKLINYRNEEITLHFDCNQKTDGKI